MHVKHFENAIDNLVEMLNLKLPFNIFPGSYPGGINKDIHESESAWDNYQWNPPELLPDSYPDADPDASTKPTWAQLEQASQYGAINYYRNNLLEDLRVNCQERITAAYGEDNHEDEMRHRLGGRHTEEQDTERERLRARYSIIKAWIQSTDRTLMEMAELDLTDDANWTGTEWPPTRAPL